MSVENRPETRPSNIIGFPVQSRIEIAGLKPEVLNMDGTVHVSTNLEDPDMLGKIAGEIEEKHPWFHDLREKIFKGERAGIYFAEAGAITFFIATAMIEIGPRHAKDIKHLYALLEKHKKNKD